MSMTSMTVTGKASERIIGKIGSAAAVLYGLWLIYLLVLLNAIIPGSGITAAGQHIPGELLPWLRAHPTLFTFLWLPELLATFVLIVVILAVDNRLQSTEPFAIRVASVYGLFGALLILSHTLIQNAAIPLASVTGPDTAAAEAAFRAVDAIIGWLIVGGFFATGLWMLLVGTVILRRGGLARWTGYAGVAGGVLGILSLFLGVPAGVLELLLWSFSIAIALPRAGDAKAESYPD